MDEYTAMKTVIENINKLSIEINNKKRED